MDTFFPEVNGLKAKATGKSSRTHSGPGKFLLFLLKIQAKFTPAARQPVDFTSHCRFGFAK